MTEHEQTIARLAGRTRYDREELRHLLEQGLSEGEIIQASEDEDFAQALKVAAALREAAERIEELLGTAAHLEPNEKRRLVRAAYHTAERVEEESEVLAILLFEPEPEECFS